MIWGGGLHASTMALIVCHDYEAPKAHKEIGPEFILRLGVLRRRLCIVARRALRFGPEDFENLIQLAIAASQR